MWLSYLVITPLLSTTVTIGISDRTAVSTSSPDIPNAASPIRLITLFSGAASLAPMDSPSP